MDDIEISVRLSGKNKAQVMDALEEGAKEVVRSIRKTIPAMGIRVRTGKMLDAVKYSRKGDGFEVYVDEKEAPYFKHLEYGYSSFPMRPGLVNSKNSKISKEGYRYAHIPINGKVITISENPSSQANWIHPGYVGRYPFHVGVEESRYKVIKTVQNLTELTPTSKDITPEDVEDWT